MKKRIQKALKKEAGMRLTAAEVQGLAAHLGLSIDSKPARKYKAKKARKTNLEPPVNVHIRWMIRRDMPETLAIDAEFEFPWTEEDFIRCLRQRNCIGMVCEFDERVVGFMIYELTKDQLHILNFAVSSKWRNRTVGTQMVKKLQGKLSAQRRNRITLEVRETNLDAQCFFASLGFKAVSVLRGYEINDEDAYGMEYRIEPKKSQFTVKQLKNEPEEKESDPFEFDENDDDEDDGEDCVEAN